MPRNLTETEREEFLAQPHIGVLSVAVGNNQPPLTVPLWYNYQPGGDLSFFTGTQGRKARKTELLEAAGCFSFCVQQPEFPYRYVTVECSIVKADRSPSVEDVYAIISRYLPEEMARGFAEAEASNPAGTFVVFHGRPDRWLTHDFG